MRTYATVEQEHATATNTVSGSRQKDENVTEKDGVTAAIHTDAERKDRQTQRQGRRGGGGGAVAAERKGEKGGVMARLIGQKTFVLTFLSH